ncbi:MAG: PSP1 domain-containing protein [Anaerolineae bacterium]|jgi:cell fate regulator YaaT (PSP1 superfamily)
MPIVCGVQFRGAGKVYYFSPGEVTDIVEGDYVIVETSRGRELGHVSQAPHEVDSSDIVGELKPILQRATPLDLLEAQRFQQQEDQALETCQEQVARFNLPMKVVQAEYNFDGSRLTFYFSADQRVDFRELVRELAHIFKTRIELRQIGVRDEAKLIGGLGKCGRPLCCATWLTDFCPVSIRMAKQQDLPLSPMEISGLCGRLLCCLVYENDFYQDIKSRFPKVGKRIDTPAGSGKVIKVNVFTEMVSVLLGDGTALELTADQVAGKAPIEIADESDTRQEALDEALEAIGIEVSEPEPRPEPDEPQSETGEEADEPENKPKKRSSRRRSRGGRNRGSRAKASDNANADNDSSSEEGQAKSGRSRRSRRSGRRKSDGRNNEQSNEASQREGGNERPRSDRSSNGQNNNPEGGSQRSSRSRRRRPRPRNNE